MSRDIEQFRKELAKFGMRLEAKIANFREQGVLHGAAREKAAELQIEHAPISRAADGDRFTVAGKIADELATDTEILNHTFDRWVDRESEQ